MANSLGERVDELRDEAGRLGLDDSEFDVPDVRLAIGAYAELLDLDRRLVYDLSLSLKEIERLGEFV